MITLGSLFSGIGGLDLGLERAGFAVRWQVEIGDYNRQVLAKHWPGVARFDDVRTFPPQEADVEQLRVDVIAGGFPCQDVSVAGRRAGIGSGTRSGLWSEFRRVLAVLRPRFVVVENTPGLLAPIKSKGEVVAPAPIGRVLGELSEMGFDAEWATVPLSAFGSAHRRERVFIVAYPAGFGGGSRCLPARQGPEGEGATELEGTGDVAEQRHHFADTDGQRPLLANRDETEPSEYEQEDGLLERDGGDTGRVGFQTHGRACRAGPQITRRSGDGSADGVQVEPADAQSVGGFQRATENGETHHDATECAGRRSPFVGSGWWGAEPDVVRMVHGIPRRLVRPAIEGLGNAVAPQQGEWIGRHLFAFTKQHGAT